jgi:hypothetical protein
MPVDDHWGVLAQDEKVPHVPLGGDGAGKAAMAVRRIVF